MFRETCLFSLVTLGACTAPPRPAEPPPPPAPTHHARIELDAPGLDASDFHAAVVPVVESALTGLPGVTALAARADEGRADVIATLTDPGAIDAVHTALARVQPQLPPAAWPPLLTRGDDRPPVLALALPLEGPRGPVKASLERTVGVAAVDTCGGQERVLVVELDRTRLVGVPVDRVLAAVDAELARDVFDDVPGRLMALVIEGTDRRISDIAQIRETLRPRACTAFNARGPVLLLTVRGQHGADPAQVAAHARAHAVDLVSPTQDFFADALPTAEAPGLAVLELDVAREHDAPAALARCLGTADLPAWALAFPADATIPAVSTRRAPAPPLRARLFLAVTPVESIESIRATVSLCKNVQRAAVLAPAADADHALGVRILGAEANILAAVAEAAAERLAAVPGVTGLRVLAPRERPAFRMEREALAGIGIAPSDVARALALVGGPLPFGAGPFVSAVELDLPDRTGTFAQDLEGIHVHSRRGAIPLAELVRADTPAWAPLYRFDSQPAAALDVHLRSAADRDAVQQALAAGLQLPPGLRLELGPGIPAFDL